MRNFVKSALILTVFFISTGMASVSLRLMRPALINIDESIRSLVIVDRTKSEKTIVDVIEGGITGENVGQDEKGVQVVLQTLTSVLDATPRFDVKRATERYKKENIAVGNFPDPLNWSTIDNICRKYQVDAVLVLEDYDTDFIVTKGKKEDGPEGKNYYAKGVGSINMSFRMYDSKNHTIADEHNFEDKSTWDVSAASVDDAVKALIGRQQAIEDISKEMAFSYTQRITPTWYTVKRYFYNKPKKSKDLMKGVRQSGIADWKGAIESWERVIAKPKKEKYAGRAAYNIAVAYEVLGDLEKAKEWASKAYKDYGEKRADDYYRVLQNRINDEARVDFQLSSPN